jgi:L-asparagine transporter-like permease
VPSLDFLWGMKKNVMLTGNTILFVATGISFILYRRSLQQKNVQLSFRMIYGGMFLKLMICLFTAMIYIMIAKKEVSKGAIFGCMFLYFVYTFVEVSVISKISRKEGYAKNRSAA